MKFFERTSEKPLALYLILSKTFQTGKIIILSKKGLFLSKPAVEMALIFTLNG